MKMLNLSTFWRGASGTTYNFDVFPYDQIFHPVAGVYVLCKKGGLRGWEALYVAEADDLRERLNQVAGGDEDFRRSREAGLTHIATLPLAGQDARRAAVSDLILGLSPRINTRG